MARRRRGREEGALEATGVRDDVTPAMSPTQRIVGLALVSASLGFTSVLAFARAIGGLFR